MKDRGKERKKTHWKRKKKKNQSKKKKKKRKRKWKTKPKANEREKMADVSQITSNKFLEILTDNCRRF